MRTSLLITTAVVFTALIGCGEPQNDNNGDADEFASHLPDDRILVGIPQGGDRAVGDLADSYTSTVQTTTDVNGIIGNVLDMVGHITDFEPTYSDDQNRYLWGPWNDGGLDPNVTALYVEFDESTNLYAWAIIQRDRDSDSEDDWVAIVGGQSEDGATENTGSGSFTIDFDAIASLNPAETNTGIFHSVYDIQEDDVEAEASFVDFGEGDGETITAGYRYGQDATGGGYMDLAYLADIQDDGSQDETIVLRTRWQGDGQGRGDMVIFDGDIAPLAYVGSECWSSDFLVVFEENNFSLQSEGDESACAFAEAEWNDDAPDDAS